MQLTILGGGGFRVPLVYGALLTDDHPDRVREVVLHDTDATRLASIERVLQQMGADHDDPPRVRASTDLDEAVAGADFVFSAIRVGGTQGRTLDERVPLSCGVLGQETTGPGGLAYALRTVPVAVHIAERIRELAPDAWTINFTNPAGIVTEAMSAVLGDRVVGICDSPIALARRAARACGVDPTTTALDVDYVGLNHLGWLQGLRTGGTDLLPDLVADPQRLATIEEGRLFGPEWLGALGTIPNEYLYYYYFTRDAVASILEAEQTRGEFLLQQQDAFYAELAARPDDALATWRRVREERDATYMREAREEDEARDAADIEGGGYEGVALAIMAAISRGEAADLILGVRNDGTVPGLPLGAVVEIPCRVDADGPHPLRVTAPTGHRLGLMAQVKEVEQLTIRASLERSPALALEALALHPLVPSVTTAREMLDGFRRRSPQIGALLGTP